MADSGLEVLDILAFYLLPETDVHDYEPALALGAELGATYALTQGNDPDWRRLVRHVRPVLRRRATRRGLTPIIEFCPNRTLATLGQTLDLLAQTGRAEIPILVDPMHLVRSEGTGADLRKVDPKRFPYAQMSDGVLAAGEPNLEIAKRIGVGTRRMPGDGTLPLREIFGALPADLPISIEVIMDRPPEISAAGVGDDRIAENARLPRRRDGALARVGNRNVRASIGLCRIPRLGARRVACLRHAHARFPARRPEPADRGIPDGRSHGSG